MAVIGTALVTQIGFGWVCARSVFLGGVIAWIPNAYLAIKISRSAGKRPEQIVRGFYTGEAIKLVLTAVLFILVFRMPDILIAPLMVGFVAAMSVQWFALLLD